MNKTEKKYVYAVIGIVLVAIAANQLGYLGAKWFTIPLSQTTTLPPVTDQMRDDYKAGIGKFQISVSMADSMDQPTARTVGTNADVIWWHYVGGQWIAEVTTVTANTQYYEARTEDNGYAWISVEAKSAQAFYVDYLKIKGSDSYIVGYQYVDVDADGAKEFVFQYSLKSHSLPSSGYPVISFKAFLLTYDSSFTLTGATNQTGWGTGTVTKFFENYASVSAEKKAIALYKIEVKLNQTIETLVRLKSMTVPGLGKVDAGSFSKSFTSSDIRWTYTFTTSFDGALYITRPVGSIGKNYFTVEYEATLTSGIAVEMDLTIYYLIAPTEAGSSVICGNTATQA